LDFSSPNLGHCDFLQENGVSQKFRKAQACRKFDGLQISSYKNYQETPFYWWKIGKTRASQNSMVFINFSGKVGNTGIRGRKFVGKRVTNPLLIQVKMAEIPRGKYQNLDTKTVRMFQRFLGPRAYYE
jgi:hypothetical protein